jgi:hypothetical protein
MCLLPAVALASSGCSLAMPARTADEVSIEGILNRCADAYRTARTISATGLVVDNRRLDRRVDPVRWDFAAPNRSRLQLGMKVCCVGPEYAWAYDAASDRFSQPQSSQTPIESTAYALTDQANFVPAGLVEKGDALFGFRDERYEPWRLDGAAWLEDRPCFKLIRRGRGADAANRWTLWIDQDSYLLRAWAWHRDLDGGATEIVWQCTFSEIRRDGPVPDEVFFRARPAPIVLPKPPGDSPQSSASKTA